ncbi:alternate-type signal peptide domain-containing protein [Georgenia muralis]|uniref:Alternate signal-mediated exported protein n=1 Tax=Georgenia muralis TaxID=154117 RepID=A0A3N4ZKS6_9MICO|nr:alternate-type signal peptide domain-containing protein [Georgenia muralis]RPF26408.1 alternate signal-mediated exported protein [Georgenia muralis]
MSRLLSAAAAGVLAVALLAGSGGSYAGWSDAQEVGGAQLVSGRLAVTAGAARLHLDRPGSPRADVTASLADRRLLPGDTLVVEAGGDLAMAGDGLSAVLTLTPSAAGAGTLPAELLAHAAVALTAANGPAPVPVTAGSWRVVPANAGPLTATLTLPVGPGASAWGAYLQGESATPALAWSLAQDAGWSAATTTALPAVTTDRLGLSVTPVPGGTRLTSTAAETRLAWRASTPTVSAGPGTTAAEAAALAPALGVGLARGTDGSSCAATTPLTGTEVLAPGAAVALCLTVAPADPVLLSLALPGRAVVATTTVTGTGVAAGGWTLPATAVTGAAYTVPTATSDAGLTLGCTAYNGNAGAALGWTWSGTSVRSWHVLARTRTASTVGDALGPWSRVTTLTAPGARTVDLIVGAIPVETDDRFDLVLVAETAAGGVVRSAQAVTAEVRGQSGNIGCLGPAGGV